MDQAHEAHDPHARLALQRRPYGDGLHVEVLHTSGRRDLERHEPDKLGVETVDRDCAFTPPVPVHLGKVKRSTSTRTRSFWRLRGNRLVLVSSAIPWRLAQNSSDITSGFDLCP